MATPRQSPHRPKRELKEVRQAEVQEYRAENQRLRRENARLRRELEKSADAWEEADREVPETMASAEGLQAVKVEAVKTGCLACGGQNIGRVKMGSKTIVCCKDCLHRFTE